jgi:hypothetical protein
MRSGSRNRVLALLASVCLVLALLTVGVVVSGASGDEEPSAESMLNIEALVKQWEEGRLQAWPSGRETDRELSAADKTGIDEKYNELKQDVGTEAWQTKEGIGLYGSLAAQMQGLRNEDPATVFTGWKAKVLDARFVRYDEAGDAVVRVTVWECHTGIRLDTATMAQIEDFVYDQTPIYDFTVRHVNESDDGAWKLQSVTIYQYSDDADPTQSGPDTPHVNYEPGVG